MNNRYFPWVILVPRQQDATEIIDLSAPDRQQLMEEIALVSQTMKTLFIPDKLNVAALGNQVAQLHVHIIARHVSDPVWPQPVWGRPGAPYGTGEAAARIKQLQDALTLDSR